MSISREQYTALRRKGFSQPEILDMSEKEITRLTQPVETFKEKGLLRTVGGFLGMEEFGKGIGQTIANIGGTQDRAIEGQQIMMNSQTKLLNKIKENKAAGKDTSKLEQALKQLGVDMETYSGQITDIGTGGLSNREVIGSAAQTGLSIVGLRGGLPTAKTLGLGARPILGGVASGALSGGAFGAAEGITEGEPVAISAFKGAVMGGAVGGALGLTSKFVSRLASKNPQKALGDMSDSLKTVKRVFDKNTQYTTVNGKRKIISDPITTLTQHKIIPSVKDGKIYAEPARQRLRELISALDDQSLAMVDDVAQSGKNVSVKEFKKITLDAIQSNESLRNKGIVGKTSKQAAAVFDDFINSFGDDITIRDVNNIRIAQNRIYNPDELDVARAIGDSARKLVYTEVPGVQAILRREGRFIAADKFLDVLDGKAVKGGRLGKYFFDLLGAMAGSTTDIPVLGPVAGALGARQISGAMQRQAIDPLTGKIARGLQSIPTETASRISKTAIMNLIGRASNQSSETRPQE